MIRSEAALQAAVHDLMHSPAEGRCCWKTQDRYRKGLPDCIVGVGPASAWVELKYVYPRDCSAADGSFLTGLEPEQRVHLREWARSGGRAYLLLAHHAGWHAIVPGMACPPTRERVSEEALRSLALSAGDLARDSLADSLARGLGVDPWFSPRSSP